MNTKITFSDKLVAWFALLSGLSISAVAVWYSVAGLVAIFAASVIPIIVMGVVLEIGKLVATIWLKHNWSIAPRLIKLYLFVAVIILMLITSMGIFGYLSKAHLDQAVPTGNVIAQVEIIDQKIQTQNDLITSARTVLRQMDETVNQSLGRGASTLPPNATPAQIQAAQAAAERNTNAAAALRRNQVRERDAQQATINKATAEIQKLREERAPLAAEIRKVEAEVGPIKYIAALIYDTKPDADLLEKAVRWVIVLIVVIFDPLAVVLLLASQYSFGWFRRQRELAAETAPVVPVVAEPAPANNEVGEVTTESLPEPSTVLSTYPQSEEEVKEFSDAKAEAKSVVLADSMPAPEPIVSEAPPGTPGEVWDAPVKSEQQAESDLDKIYKASSEELAKKKRSRGWFNAQFPKRDN
jgi:hypothetical protein